MAHTNPRSSSSVLLSVLLVSKLFASGRWYWAIRMEDNKAAALPSTIGRQVEILICGHRRERKTFFDKKPAGWLEKLKKVNEKIMTIIWNRKTAALADPRFVKKSTRIVGNLLQFTEGSGRNFELIRLQFKANDSDDVAGPGVYWLWSTNFEAKPVVCISAEGDRSGFDLLREAYAGHGA